MPQKTPEQQSCPAHLYLHWPFCSKKCHFCDFVAFEQHGQFHDEYHAALRNELVGFAEQCNQQKPIKTIFIGGGTPSLYPLSFLVDLFLTLQTSYNLQAVQEISMEVNPADVDEEKLDTWHQVGINRLSVGVQSLNDEVLLGLNRRQRVTDVLRVMKLAPKYISNLSIDLILGLPGIDSTAWRKQLEQVVTWPINHISVYFLTIHENTPLYFKVAKGSVALSSDQNLVDDYLYTIDFLAKHGFDQYEISNFARQGYTSTHNKAYWQRVPYRGFGIGASSFDGSNRCTTTKNLPSYLEALRTPDLPPAHCEQLTDFQAALEVLMLSLRTAEGTLLHDVVYYLDAHQKEAFLDNVNRLSLEGVLHKEDGRIWLPTHLLPLENEIVAKLL